MDYRERQQSQFVRDAEIWTLFTSGKVDVRLHFRLNTLKHT